MLRLKVLFVGLFLVLSSLGISQAQTLDSILAKNYVARGGLEKIRSIKSIQITGKLMMQGMELPITVMMKRPSSVRSEISVQGQKIISAYDGKDGWMINPMMGSKDPMNLPSEEMKNVKEQADMDGILVDWKEKGHKVEYIGKENVEGADVYHLKVTLKDTSVRNIYIDADSYLEIQQKGKYPAQGKEIEVVTSLGGYKKVDGLTFPFTTEGKVEGKTVQQTTFDSLQMNITLPDSLFARPAAAKKESEKKAPEKK